MRLEGFAEARALHAQHGGIILVELHQGNYEWVSLGTGFAGLPLWIVALDFKNPALETVFGEARGHSGHRLINRHQSMLRLLRAVRRNGGVGLLVDLALGLEHPGEVIETFGLKMHVTFLHALLHQRTGIPIIPVTNIAHPDGTCTITAHPPLAFAADAPASRSCKAAGTFSSRSSGRGPSSGSGSYRHWRNKPRETTREYPSYAYCTPKFERVLAGQRAFRRPKPPRPAAP